MQERAANVVERTRGAVGRQLVVTVRLGRDQIEGLWGQTVNQAVLDRDVELGLNIDGAAVESARRIDPDVAVEPGAEVVRIVTTEVIERPDQDAVIGERHSDLRS